MDSTLLYVGLLWEYSLRTARTSFWKTIARLEAALEAYDQAHGRTEPCTKNLLCERQGVRHKQGCPGKQETIETYVKGVMQA